MAYQKRSIKRDEPISLRRNNGSPQFTDEQMVEVAIFAAAVIQSGHGFYFKANAEGNSIRLKIYTDDDTYQDTVSNQENLIYLFSDYAKQLKCEPIFQALLAELHRHPGRAAQEAPGGPAEGGAAPTPLRRGSKS